MRLVLPRTSCSFSSCSCYSSYHTILRFHSDIQKRVALALKMEAAYTFETSATLPISTRRKASRGESISSHVYLASAMFLLVLSPYSASVSVPYPLTRYAFSPCSSGFERPAASGDCKCDPTSRCVRLGPQRATVWPSLWCVTQYNE
jgi:hypothetical protein